MIPTSILRFRYLKISKTCVRCYLADEKERSNRFLSKMMKKKSIEDVLNTTGVEKNVATGVPSFLTRSKGHTRTISRRQAMLNKHFIEGLTDVLSTEAVGQTISDYGVRITQVETGQHYNYLNIYWVIPEVTRVTEIGLKLNALGGELAKKMIERNFMTVIPIIRFNFDKNKVATENIYNALKHQQRDTKPDVNKPPVVPEPPTLDAKGYFRIDPLRPKLYQKKVLLFYEEFSKKKSAEDKSNYKIPSFKSPEDMNLVVFGLDYKQTMDKILANLKRSRAEHRGYNPVADPLPPSSWVSPSQPTPDHLKDKIKLDTYDRIQIMKNFIVENKRKKDRMYRVSKAEKDDYYLSISDRLDSVMEKVQSDSFDQTSPYDAPDHYEDEDDRKWLKDD